MTETLLCYLKRHINCDAGSGNLDAKAKHKRKKKKHQKEDDEQKTEVLKEAEGVKNTQTAKKNTTRAKASAREAKTDGNNLPADLGDVEATHNAGMPPDRPKAQAAVPHHKDGVSAESSRAPASLEAQTADPGARAAPQTAQELTLRIRGCNPGDSPTHGVASRAGKEGGASHSAAAPPAALQDAPNLQVSKCFSHSYT